MARLVEQRVGQKGARITPIVMIKTLIVKIMGKELRIESKSSHCRHTILYQISDTQWLKYLIASSCRLCCINECHCDPEKVTIHKELSAFRIIEISPGKLIREPMPFEIYKDGSNFFTKL